jgi:hypothetical protein
LRVGRDDYNQALAEHDLNDEISPNCKGALVGHGDGARHRFC